MERATSPIEPQSGPAEAVPLGARFEESRRRLAAGRRLMPGGVGSDYRLGVSPSPLVIDRGSGPYVYDADGHELIDYYLGMGPLILGHSPEPVITAVEHQLRRGLLFAGQSELEYEAAHLVIDLVPCAELVRFGSSGSEVVQAALRVARAATGRSTIIKFEGHYHGWFDNVLWSVSPPLSLAGPATAPRRVPGSAGQDPAAGEHTEILPWNDLDVLVRRLDAGDIAAVIMEPAMCNTSAVLPLPGYLEGVRDACSRTGTVLIFDEVITGFRVAPGGAQERLGVTPDLATFGKALGGGFPVACLAGRADLMDRIGGPGGVIHAGTYNGQTVVMAATIATLRVLVETDAYAHLDRIGRRLRDGISAVLEAHGMEARIQGWPEIFHVALGTSEPITDYRSSLRADRQRYVRLTSALLERGVRALERGAWFISTAHDEAVVDRTLDAIDDALAVI